MEYLPLPPPEFQPRPEDPGFEHIRQRLDGLRKIQQSPKSSLGTEIKVHELEFLLATWPNPEHPFSNKEIEQIAEIAMVHLDKPGPEYTLSITGEELEHLRERVSQFVYQYAPDL